MAPRSGREASGATPALARSRLTSSRSTPAGPARSGAGRAGRFTRTDRDRTADLEWTTAFARAAAPAASANPEAPSAVEVRTIDTVRAARPRMAVILIPSPPGRQHGSP